MSKVIGVVNGQKIYDDNLRLVQWQQNVDYYYVMFPFDDIAAPHCKYCGSITYAIHRCPACGAPLK